MESYFANIRPVPFTVLGISLRAFSLGHAHLLTKSGNSFLNPSDDSKGDRFHNDLIEGVFVCSRSWRKYHRDIDSRWAAFSVRLWAWKWNRRKGTWAEPMQLFRKYLNEGFKRPDVATKEGGKASATHFLQSVRITLQGRLGMSYEEAMDYPLSAALHDFFAFWEQEGRCDIAELTEHRKEVERMQEELFGATSGDGESGETQPSPTD